MIDRLKASDLEPLKRLYTEPRCRQFLGGPIGEREAQRRVEQLLASDVSTHSWAIRLPSGEAIGLVTLGQHHDRHDTEVSYLLLPEYWGAGIATRAVRLAITYAFHTMGLPRLAAETQSANKASIRLLERVGMAFDRNVSRFGSEQSIYMIEANQD